VKVALDTNVLVYMEAFRGEQRGRSALELVNQLRRESIVIPTQALGELFNVLVRKVRVSRPGARDLIITWTTTYAVASVTESTFLAAIDLATTHQLAIWDAIIVATAADAGCQVLLSEDMHHGFAWSGVTVVIRL